MFRVDGSQPLQIVSGAKEGNKQAYADLFHRHKRTVYSLCLHMSNDLMEAEGLTQHAFISAYRRLNGSKAETSFSTWAHRIAACAAVTNLRKARPDMLSIDKSMWLKSSFQEQESAPGKDQPLGGIDRTTLLQAMEKLPPVCRAVFILHDVQGYQHHEVANLLEFSVDSSRAQLHKARMSIRNSALQARNVKDGSLGGQRSGLRFRILKVS